MANKIGKFANCPHTSDIVGYLLEKKPNKLLEIHIEQCLRCREQLYEMQAILKDIRQPPIALPKDLTGQILAKIDQRYWRKKQHWRGKSKFFKAVTVTALVVICIVLCVTVANIDEPPDLVPLARVAPKMAVTTKNSRAITAALKWLAKNQERNGSWAAEKWGGKKENTVALTGLVLLAFFKDAKTSYRQTMTRAIDYIIARQNSDGLFGPRIDKELYNHGIATLALLNGNRDGKYSDKMRQAIQRALDFICNRQNSSGGWGYLYSSMQSNISISVWQLQSALMAISQGWKYPKSSIDMGFSWLQHNVNEQGYAGYRQLNDFPYGSETSTAITTWLLIGTDKLQTLEKQRLKRSLNNISHNVHELNYYGWYFLGNALRITQGNNSAWKDRTQKALGEKQIREGKFQGTWEADDRWGKAGGRIYSTALAILVLQNLQLQ